MHKDQPVDEVPLVEVPSDEEFIPTPKPEPSGFDLFPPVTSTMIPNMMLLFLAVTSFIGMNNNAAGSISPFFVSQDSVFRDGEWFRLLFAAFGHSNPMHFFSNALPLWFFTYLIVGYFGWRVWIFSFFVIACLSNLIAVFTYEPQVRLLGASGVVYGLVALWLTLYVYFDRSGHWTKRFVRSIGFSMVVFFPQQYEVNVSYMAHAAGFGVGLLMGFAFVPLIPKISPLYHDPHFNWKPVQQLH